MFDVSPLAGLVVAPATELDAHRLLRDVCAKNDVHPSLVRSSRRDAELVAVRREIARVLRDAGCSLPEIGRMLGGRHHTTVMALLDPEMSKRKYLAWRVA